MASMLRPTYLIRSVISRTSIAKPLSYYTNRSFNHGLKKNFNINKHNSTLNTLNEVACCARFVHNTVPIVAEERNERRVRRQPFKNQNTPSIDFEKSIFELDISVRRSGRLVKANVEDLYNKIKEQGKVTASQALLTIRCCGSLMPEEVGSARTELVHKIWDTLEELNCALDVSHYNMLLKVYLENDHKFSPIDFLANMESKGTLANRVTYQRLIARFCTEGDIEGASKILEFMKEKEIAVNESVFNELIFGHAKANDINGAKEVIEVMRNAKLDPSADTYCALARAYSLQGNLEGVTEAIDEAERNETYMFDKHYLDIVYTLAVNGHEKKVDDVLRRTKKGLGYNQDCINVIFELVNAGKDDVGFKVLQTMTPVISRDGTVLPSGHFFLRRIVRIGRPAEVTIKFCNDLENLNLNHEGLVNVTSYALEYKKPEQALLLLKEMAAKGLPIRNHYFWAVLIEKAKEGEQAIYDVLQAMTELGCPPSYETLLEYVLPHINTMDPDIVVQKMKDLGLTAGSIVNTLTSFYLMNHKPKEAANLLDKYPVRLVPRMTARALALSLKELEDIDPILMILSHVHENPEIGADKTLNRDWSGQMLVDYAREKDFDLSTFESLIRAMLKKKLYISYVAAENIKRTVQVTLPPDIIKVLENLAINDIKDLPTENDSTTLIAHPNDMNVEELENHLLELKSKNMQTRGVLRRLLLVHCKNQNVKRAMEIMDEIRSSNLNMTPAMHAQLLNLYISTENVQEALKQYETVVAYPEFQLDTFKVLNLATLMVKAGMGNEAIDILSQHTPANRPNYEFLKSNVFRLLKAASDKGDLKLTKKLFELTVIKFDYAKPSSFVLGPIINACLVNKDFAEAQKEFENAVSTYKCTPYLNEIFCHLISTEDTENLQKIVDVTTTIHGENNTLINLALSFISCDCFKQAKKILGTPGLRANNERLNLICQNLTAKRNIKDLEQFVYATKNLFEIDRDMMYYNLLLAFAKENNVDKALGILTSMQEENLRPSSKTLIFLAEFLKQHNRPIPFEVPEKQLDFNFGTTHGARNKPSNDTRPKNSNKSGLNLKKNLENSETFLEKQRQSDLILLCLKEQRVKEAFELTKTFLQNHNVRRPELLSLLHSLVESGDTEAFQKIEPLIRSPSIFENFMCKAYIHSGKPLSAMERLEKDPKLTKEHFPTNSLVDLLRASPENEDRIAKMAERYHKEFDCWYPKNSLWQYYMIKGDYQKADHIYDTCFKGQNKLQLTSIFNHLGQESSLELAEKFSSLLSHSDISNKAKGIAISHLIRILVNKNEVDDAVKRLEAAQKQISLTFIDLNVLKYLKRELQNQGKNVPFDIDEIRNLRNDSSESSDSSSDDEVTVKGV